MVLKVCSVMDVKAKAFMVPFFMANTNLAVRAFGDACNDAQNGISKHPEDYHLYCVGEFDDNSGVFVSATPGPEFLAKAVDFINSK